MAKPFLSAGTRVTLLVILLCATGRGIYTQITRPVRTIKVVILHAFGGTMAVSEKPLVPALQLALERGKS